jgi:hypothetical protein
MGGGSPDDSDNEFGGMNNHEQNQHGNNNNDVHNNNNVTTNNTTEGILTNEQHPLMDNNNNNNNMMPQPLLHEHQLPSNNNNNTKTPVLSTAATAGLVGAILGSFTGSGTLAGGLLFSSFGAYAATRQDNVGIRARELGLQAQQIAKDASEHPLTKDVQRQLAPVAEKLTTTAEKYHVPERVQQGKLLANRLITHGVEFEREIVKPKVSAAVDAIKKRDSNGYITKAEIWLQTVNEHFKLSESFNKTRDAVSNELDLLFSPPTSNNNNSGSSSSTTTTTTTSSNAGSNNQV